MQILHDLVPDRRGLFSGSVANRIELRLEQADEPRGDLWVRGHRIVAVLIREPRRDPHPIRAVRAEDVDLLPGQTAHDHQAVEGIHLRLAAPHRAERVADRLGGALEVEHRTASVQDAEVVDEDPSFALQVDGDLLDDAELSEIERWVVTEVPLTVEGADTFMPANFLEGFRPYDSRELGDGLKVTFYERAR